MCIVRVVEIAPVSAYCQGKCSYLNNSITGLPVRANIKKPMRQYSKSPLVKCLFMGLKPLVIRHVLDDFFPFIFLQQKLKVTNRDY